MKVISLPYQRPPSAIAGWRGEWIAPNGSEGTRPALLPAGPVPERWNTGFAFIETLDGQQVTGRACWPISVFAKVCVPE